MFDGAGGIRLRKPIRHWRCPMNRPTCACDIFQPREARTCPLHATSGHDRRYPMETQAGVVRRLINRWVAVHNDADNGLVITPTGKSRRGRGRPAPAPRVRRARQHTWAAIDETDE